MEEANYTKAERVFRVWMLISAWMFAVSGLFFLVAGVAIAPFVNSVSQKLLPALPLYPLPAAGPEGKFWLALSLSMMAMITYICRAVYLDPRRNGRLVPVLLLSKFCSSAFYMAFFITYGQLAHLVGFMTDGPIFVATFALWVFAAPGDKYFDGAEEDTLAAMGEAFFPRGGAFELGYMDVRDECIAGARRLFSKQDPSAVFSCRIMIRFIDLSPLLLSLRPVTLRRLPLAQRQDMLRRIENHRLSPVRMILFALKIMITLPFFDQAEAARAVGFLPAEELK